MLGENSELNGRYRLIKKIGQGGFAQVFLATDLVLNRAVAIKVLHLKFSNNPEILERFRREAQAVAALNHPNILPVFDYGELSANQAYLVMPYVEGGTLQDRMKQNEKLSQEEIGNYLSQAAAAIDYAHRRNLVHRDIKPQNMLISAEDNRLLLADFGISKVLSASSGEESTTSIGTVYYMAPEQLRGHVGRATDIYALGCVLFRLLTGQPPYSGPAEQVITSHLFEPVPSLTMRSQGSVDARLQAVIERALAKDPQARYASAGELVEAYRAIIKLSAITPPGISERPTEKAELPSDTLLSLPVRANRAKPQKKAALRFFGWSGVGVLALLVGALLVAVLLLSNSSKPTNPLVIQLTGPTTTAGSQAVNLSTPTPPSFSATKKEVATLSGHSATVNSSAFSPDGRYLASASFDKTVKLWDVAGRKEIATFKGHSDWVYAVAFDPKGERLASASKDNTVKLWDVASSKELATLRGHTGWVYSVAFSPDGRYLASGSEDGTVKLWDATSFQEVAEFKGHSEPVYSVAFSPDENLLASGSRDKTVKLWEIAARKELATLRGHLDYVAAVAFSPDGKRLASGSGDQTIKVWDVASYKTTVTLNGAGRPISSVAFSPDGTVLVSTTLEVKVEVWELEAGQGISFITSHTGPVVSVAFSPDGKLVASNSEDSTIKLWETGN